MGQTSGPNQCRHGLVLWDCPACQQEPVSMGGGGSMPGDRDEKYNGWTNWDTWCLHLWMTNVEDVYHKAVVMAGEPERFNRWCFEYTNELHRTEKEAILFHKVNVDEIREALLDD